MGHSPIFYAPLIIKLKYTRICGAQERAKHKELWPLIADARKKGLEAKFREDKALINGMLYGLNELKKNENT